jgi:glycogen operon protein
LNGRAETLPAEVHWYGEGLEPPDWQDPEARVLCFTLPNAALDEPALHVMINMASTPRELPLPEVAERNWRRIVDTTLGAPIDVVPAGVVVAGNGYRLGPHGIAVFEDDAGARQSGTSTIPASGGSVSTIELG